MKNFLPHQKKISPQKISDEEEKIFLQSLKNISENRKKSNEKIYESECKDEIYLPEKGKRIGKIEITDLKESKEGDKTVLTMTINRSGLMNLKAVDERTGKTVKAEIHLDD